MIRRFIGSFLAALAGWLLASATASASTRGGYAVVVSAKTQADAAWQQAITRANLWKQQSDYSGAPFVAEMACSF